MRTPSSSSGGTTRPAARTSGTHLRAGGRYQLEGNAGGETVRGARPAEIGLTWEMGGGVTELVVRLEPDGPDATVLTLSHAPR